MNAEERINLVERQLTDLGTAVARLTDLLTGGILPEKGLIVMVDRLMQSELNRRYWSRWAVGIAISSIITSVGAVLTMLLTRH